MSTEIKVPTLPESVADATVLTWHKAVGDSVQRDEVLVDIETDKVVLEVPAPADGTLEGIAEDEGATVTADQILGTIVEGAVAASKPSAVETVVADATEPEAVAEPQTSPAVRKLLAEHGLDASAVKGTGKNGRLTKEDVLAHVEAAQSATAQTVPAIGTDTAPPAASESSTGIKFAAPPSAAGVNLADEERPQRRVPMTRLRARIAERLMQATTQTAMLTTFNEINMKPLIDLRKEFKERFEKQHGIKLGFMSMFVKAAAEALKRFPDVNASIDGNDIVYHGFCDIGVAVSSDRGLVVPILRNAEYLSLAQIEGQIMEYATQAREGKLGIEAMTGGTFTITNGGVFGSLLSTPILNPPQSAILGMHATQERPVVENGEIVVRPMMYVALSYDHRIVDGKGAVTFLKTIKGLVEEPARILLDI
ncbi:MAG: 2-oxoglutarate dehydrogenase complex dihydrolipoyllysine-residue succinyltransferase [Pseudomonadota bacterium]